MELDLTIPTFWNDLEGLRAAFVEEKKKRIQLEEDCDLLALENVRLREELATARSTSSSSTSMKTTSISHSFELSSSSEPDEGSALTPPHPPAPVAAAAASSVSRVEDSVWRDLLRDGDGLFPNTIGLSQPNACGGKNVTAVSFIPHLHHNELDSVTLVAAAGVDAAVSIYLVDMRSTPSSPSSSKIWTGPQSAPVLALDACVDRFGASWLAAGCMDGSHSVVRVMDGVNAESRRFKNHSKYVISVRWSGDGSLLAVASHDKTVSIHRLKLEDTQSAPPVDGSDILEEEESHSFDLELVTTLTFHLTPESVLFAPTTSEVVRTGWDVILALRDCSYLTYVHTESMETRQVSLNEADWDTHCSFTALHLSLSPCSRYITVATDKDLHLVYQLGTNSRLRLFSAHVSGDYGNPRTAWDISGSYVFSNSTASHCIVAYSLASERVVGELSGHRGTVRDVKVHPSKRLVVSASYDKSFIVWCRK